MTAVNDAPEGSDKTVTVVEDGTYVLTATDFGFSDAADTPANAFASVTITQLPAAGSLQLDGSDVGQNQVISRADIDAGKLTFTPAADANGAGCAELRFAVTDDGGTANGGEDTDQTPNTIAFDVTAVNDPPVLSDLGDTLAYAVNAGATVIDGSITLTDVDSANIRSAMVQITGNYQGGEDMLSIDSAYLPSGVTVLWDATTGTLTLSGEASPAEYESMLEHVTYTNSNAEPDYGDRSVTWTVNDGELDSALRTSTIRLRDAPLLNPVLPDPKELGLNDFQGSNAFSGTFGLMPDIDSLLSFLSHRGLLSPYPDMTELGTSEFQTLRQHLSDALYAEGWETRHQVWDDLMLFLEQKKQSGGSEELLNLKDFFKRLREQQSGTVFKDILLAFNADEIHLVDWLNSLAGPGNTELPAGQAPQAGLTGSSADWTDGRSLMFNTDDLKIMDLLLSDADRSLVGTPGLAAAPVQAAAWVLNPSEVSFNSFLMPVRE